MFEKLLRKNIQQLIPYSSARNEFSGTDATFLDANENPYNAPYNRYPDPLQLKLKVAIARLKKVTEDIIFLGNGSDEAIDLLIRAFCEPGADNIITMDPSYGMYKVCAQINGVETREILLDKNFQIDKKAVLNAVDRHTKIIFLCSPNNPTSNSFFREDIIYILENFDGMVVLDEAYIDFSEHQSLLPMLFDYPNLVVLQTMSKAWGLAGLRLGMAFAHLELIRILNNIKYPYNINAFTQNYILQKIDAEQDKNRWVENIIQERTRIQVVLKNLTGVKNIIPSDANFLMVQFNQPKELYEYLLNRSIVVRDRSSAARCEGYLRFTVGTPKQNDALLVAVSEYLNKTR
jgi:histidinol-phosphate aminotransferase